MSTGIITLTNADQVLSVQDLVGTSFFISPVPARTLTIPDVATFNTAYPHLQNGDNIDFDIVNRGVDTVVISTTLDYVGASTINPNTSSSFRLYKIGNDLTLVRKY